MSQTISEDAALSAARAHRARRRPWAPFRRELLDGGLLIPTGVDGLYGRSGNLRGRRRRHGPTGPAGRGRPGRHLGPLPPGDALGHLREERLPRVVPRPDGIGAHLPRGRGPARRAPASGPRPTRTGARCSRPPTWCSARRSATPLYPTMGGTLPDGGRRVEVYGYCFRHEPSTDPFRMQSFRQHDYVFLGTPDGARAHRDLWIERGLEVLTGLGLEVDLGRGQRPVLRSGRPHAGRQPAHGGAEVRNRHAGLRHRAGDRHLLVELPPRPLRPALRDRDRRRRGGPHRLRRFRHRPDHPGPPAPPRPRPGSAGPARCADRLWP